VKITGSAPVPLLPDDSLFSPDPCLSEAVKLDPIDSALFPTLDDEVAAVLTDEGEDPEFGEFLLDAVDWL